MFSFPASRLTKTKYQRHKGELTDESHDGADRFEKALLDNDEVQAAAHIDGVDDGQHQHDEREDVVPQVAFPNHRH